MSDANNNDEHDTSTEDDDDEMRYEVSEVIGKRNKRGRTEYLVSWKNYGPDGNSWQPAENLVGATALVDAYNKNNPRRPKRTAKTKTVRKMLDDLATSSKGGHSGEHEVRKETSAKKKPPPDPTAGHQSARRSKKRRTSVTPDSRPVANDEHRRSVAKRNRHVETEEGIPETPMSEHSNEPISDEAEKTLKRLRLYGTTSAPRMPSRHLLVIEPHMQILGVEGITQVDGELMYDVVVRGNNGQVETIRVPFTEMAARGGRAAQLALTHTFSNSDVIVRVI